VAEPKCILVVIDPTTEEQPALARAGWLAKCLGARLELFICAYDQYLSGERFFDSAGLEKARGALIAEYLQRLTRLAEQSCAEGIPASVDVRWDHPLDHGIVRKTTEAQPIMVVKDTHYHPALERALFSNTDWNLIRSCPVPLCLVKPRELAKVPIVIAAVDPTHEHDKPAALDHAILALAEELTTAVKGNLHVLHAFDPAPAIAGAADTMATPIAVPVRELTEALEIRHRTAVADLLADHPVDKDKVHIHQGVPQALLTTLAAQLDGDMVIMGAVARTGLRRVFLGSTAERVLDRLPCDLVVVKADGFEVPG